MSRSDIAATKVHIVIGGVGGEEIEVFRTLVEAQRYCGSMNTERQRIGLTEPYNHRVVTRLVHARRPFTCRCGECRPDEFRASEPGRCKACRRAYNAKRKRELKGRS